MSGFERKATQILGGGAPVPIRSRISFEGDGVVVEDDPSNRATRVTISGGGGSGGNVTAEEPSGTKNGVNRTFSLSTSIAPGATLWLECGGIILNPGAGNDYQVSGTTITFEDGRQPEADETLRAIIVDS